MYIVHIFNLSRISFVNNYLQLRIGGSTANPVMITPTNEGSTGTPTTKTRATTSAIMTDLSTHSPSGPQCKYLMEVYRSSMLIYTTIAYSHTPYRSYGKQTISLSLLPFTGTCTCTLSTVLPISIGALMVLVGIAIFTAGVVMLVRANHRRVLDHSPKPPPPPGTDHYEVMDEEKKSTPLGAGVYEEVDKQDTEGHNKHYQELDLMKVEGSEYASMKP